MSSNQVRRVSSLDSTSSVSSTSSQRLGLNAHDPNHEYATTAAVTTSYGRHLSDVCAVLIHCPKHERFMLVKCAAHRGALWLPYVALRQSEGWYAAIVNKIRQLLGVRIGTKSSSVFTPPEIMHIMRIQLPEVLKYVTRVVFMTNLQSVAAVASPSAANAAARQRADSNESSGSLRKQKQQQQQQHHQQSVFECACESSAPAAGATDSQDSSGVYWLRHEQIVQEEEQLEIWGPEPGMFTSAFATQSVEKGAYSEYTLREAVRFQPRDQQAPRTYQEEMLRSCHFERGDILRLYSDYVQHCYPSQNMNYVSFQDYMLTLGYEHASEHQARPGGGASGRRQPESPSGPLHASASGTPSPRSTLSRENSIAAAAAPGAQQQQQQQQQQASLKSPVAKLNAHDMRSLYRAFKLNRQEMPYVTFHELLLGLAAMDRSTAHGGHSGELRCGYIFRYYDANHDGQLSASELYQMAHDRLRVAQVKQAQSLIRTGVAAALSTSKSDSSRGKQRRGVASTTTAQQVRSGAAAKQATGSKSLSSGSITNRALESSLQRIDAEAIKRELAHIYQQLQLKMGDSISEMNFMLAVGSMQLRGTSTLFRSQISVLPVKQHYDTIVEKHALTDIEGNLIGGELKRKGTCPRCKEKSYTLALHTVKLTQEAQIIEPSEVHFDEYPAPISRVQRLASRATFATDSTANKLVDMITTYWNAVTAANYQVYGTSVGAACAPGPASSTNQLQLQQQHQAASSTATSSDATSAQVSGGGGGGGGAQLANVANVPSRMAQQIGNAVPLGKTSWERVDRKQLADDIRKVCLQAEAIFKHEPRVVSVNSPCHVLGDIHGNLNDLRIYERILWPNAPACVAGSFLFLGDYVDRGDHGLECICYLLCMKVLAPRTFYLLRGNHEIRSIQQAFTFFREVNEKFLNQQLGLQVWEQLNRVFDLMPVAATIDDHIFCSHGGIPTSALRLDELVNIPTPLTDPENQSPAAWEILWNDPVSSTEYAEYADLLRKQPGGVQAMANMQGYLPNTKRGTAFFFSEEAVKRFLRLNGLSHIIRAHECVPPGYALHCNGKVITIFSSSHYCGATNDAACILVEHEKLRIIRLDTD